MEFICLKMKESHPLSLSFLLLIILINIISSQKRLGHALITKIWFIPKILLFFEFDTAKSFEKHVLRVKEEFRAYPTILGEEGCSR